MISVIHTDDLFQFHKGTIKPVGLTHHVDVALEFQFHKGTIKPRQLYYLFAAIGLFQFHKGTIKPIVPTFLV